MPRVGSTFKKTAFLATFSNLVPTKGMETLEIHWDQVVDDLGPRLYRYFCGSFSASTASDAVQETLLRLVQKSRDGSYQPHQGSLSSYAFGIAHWVRSEYLKKNRALTLVEEERFFDDQPAPAASAFEEQVTHLRSAIAKLKSVEQEIILLTIDDELSLNEISAITKLPLGTVKSHIHRAKENLRLLMGVQK